MLYFLNEKIRLENTLLNAEEGSYEMYEAYEKLMEVNSMIFALSGK